MTIALHGATAAIHDHLARRKGDYDAAVAKLREAKALEVVTEVTRANARSLAALAQFLTAPRWRDSVLRWTLRWPGTPRAGLSPSRLGMVTPRVLHAAATARQAGLEVRTSGLPACVLGPHAEFAVATTSRAYAKDCDGCRAKATCPGVPQRYLEAFGRDLELRPL